MGVPVIGFVFLVCILCVHAQAFPKNPALTDVFDFIDQYHPNTELYDGLGNCSFPVTSTSPNEVQPYFDMGICMLHSFWPSEAIRAFRRVISFDSTCAMAYWGLYQAFNWDYGYILARNQSLGLAQQYLSLASERGQLYIQAELAGYDWNSTYQLLMEEYPWDINAKSFWAWAEVDSTVNYMDATLPYRTVVQAFLKNQTIYYPTDIGLHHYVIHAWEDTVTPYEAITASEAVTSIAPNGGHIVHMPGHIYHLLGQHDTAHLAFYQAKLSDDRAMSFFGVNFQEYWEYIHNIAYMTGNLGEAGRLTEATQWATALQALEVDPNQPLLLDWDPVYNRPAARYYFQGLVALPLLNFQYSKWADAQTTLTLIGKYLSTSINDTSQAWLLNYYDALQQYACVMGAYDAGDLAAATVCSTQLQSDYAALAPNMNAFGVGRRSYFSLGVNVAEAAAVILALQKNWEGALQALSAANASEAKIPYNEPPIYTRPVLATYADVLLRMANETGDRNYIVQAVATYKEILASPWHNNSGFEWYGVGYSYSLLGDSKQAVSAFGNFLSAWSTADRTLSQIVYAQLYVIKTAELDQRPKDSDGLFTGERAAIFSLACLVAVLIALLIVQSRRHSSKYTPIP